MKNQKMLIGSLAVAVTITAGVAYLLLTKDGEELLHKLSTKIKDALKDAASGIASDKTGVKKTTVKKVADQVIK